MGKKEDTILIFAARYAHSRNTAAAFVVVGQILANWHMLSKSTKEQLKREAKNEAVYNLSDWAKLKELKA